MTQEYSKAAYDAFIESMIVRATELATEAGRDGISEQELLVSMGTTLINIGQTFLIQAISASPEMGFQIGPNHPWNSGG